MIIGGGLSGLIWAYYHPDSVLIGDDIGGQFNSSFPLGVRFLHDTPAVRKLLNELKIKFKPKTIKVGYLQNNKIINAFNDEFANKYFAKSRGQQPSNQEIFMNNKQSSFPALIVDFNKLINELKKVISLRHQLIIGRVVKIDAKNKLLFYLSKYGDNKQKRMVIYSEIINTIPLNFFLELMDEENNELKALPVTFIYYSTNDELLLNTDVDFIYIADEESVAHRINIIEKEKNKVFVVAEWFGAHNDEEIKKAFGDGVISYKVLNSQIISIETPQIESVKLIGRYGAWNRSWRIDKVVEEAIKNE